MEDGGEDSFWVLFVTMDGFSEASPTSDGVSSHFFDEDRTREGRWSMKWLHGPGLMVAMDHALLL